ncbi:hypothetical protein HK100_000127 [Physocladia obscura]|uniref:Ribosome biogenesis protein NOP53 n=1 Tax=Physocladia obscura TaxID=109957 RepID=A0AAD5T0M1_9FUNG|nr:hypothetical protein HK100_000127 [Physocladia obscura]
MAPTTRTTKSTAEKGKRAGISKTNTKPTLKSKLKSKSKPKPEPKQVLVSVLEFQPESVPKTPTPVSLKAKQTSQAAVQKKSSGSRKGKKAWVKNVDIAQIETAIDDLRNEKRLTGSTVVDKTNAALFTIDKKGTERPTIPLKNRLLRIDEIIIPKSGFPAKQQLPRRKTTVVIHHDIKKDKLKLASKSLVLQIERIAKRLKENPNFMEDKSKRTRLTAADSSLWNESGETPVEFSNDPNDYLAHLRPKKVKKPNLPETKPMNIPAVKVSHSGASYNPSFPDHQNLLQAALDVELRKERINEEFKKKLSYPPELDDIDDENFFDSDEDEDQETQETEKVAVETFLMGPAKEQRKTRAERKKVARKAEAVRKEAHLKDQAKINNQVTKIAKIQKEINAQESAPKKQKKTKAPRLGPLLSKPLPLEIKLTDELPESLLKLKPEGNLFKDRFQSLQERSIIETRVPQGLDNPPNYIVADYLAEVTMGILARQSKANRGGFVTEFVDEVFVRNANSIVKKNLKIITNAGGLDPVACKIAIEKAAEKAGISIVVAAVLGDDAWKNTVQREQMLKCLANSDVVSFGHLGSTDVAKEEWPQGKEENILSVNIYMGVGGILHALKSNASIIVTGRVVDSALVLAPLMHEFNWSLTSFDLLAAGSLAGHIIECGCHATGGNFTDWRLVASSANGGYANMGYPIVEVEHDGSFVVTKPPKTGGLVSVGTVSEQMIYEVLDPAAYILPDVVLDMTEVKVSQVGPDRVLVIGAKGRAPSDLLKTSGVYVDGFKISAELMIGGEDSVEKGKAVGEAIVKRVSTVLKKLGQSDFTDYNIECLGAEHTYGPHSKATRTRETVLRITVCHQSKSALLLFGREVPASATSMAPGITGFGSGRASPSPNMRHFSVLVPKKYFPSHIVVGQDLAIVSVPYPKSNEIIYTAKPKKSPPSATSAFQPKKLVKVKLIELCLGRSGDKGDSVNIGLISRDRKFYPYLCQAVTIEKVKAWMGHLIMGSVVRYELPGSFALNFVCTKALGGGGLASLRIDRQGKTYGQMLLQMKIEVPENWSVANAKL